MRYGHLIPKIYPTGVFIESIEQTKSSDESAGENVFIVTLTNHTQQRLVVKNGHTGSACEGINEIRASVDSNVGTPSVKVVETDAGAKKNINFIFKNLKGEKGDIALTEDVKQYIDNRLAEVKMPLNPAAHYDMADVQYKDITPNDLKNFSTSFEALQSNFVHTNVPKTITASLKNNVGYRISADFRVIEGNPQYATMLYYDYTTNTQLYTAHTKVINGECHCVLEFVCKNTDLQGHNLQIIFHSGEAGATYGIASKWFNFKLETLNGGGLIDSSGNNEHAKIFGGVGKVVDNKTGSALSFNKGSLTRPPQDFIGVGKQWSHSRWVKINPTEQDAQTNPRLWYYGGYDYCIFNIGANNGQIGDISLLCYKNSSNFLGYYLPKESVTDNQWHHLVVMTDLQPSYCRKIIYLDRQKIIDKKVTGDFSNWIDNTVHTDMNVLTSNYVKGSLANLIFFDRLLTEREVLWLCLNPYYPAKHYSLAEYKADENRALLEELKKRIPTP